MPATTQHVHPDASTAVAPTPLAAPTYAEYRRRNRTLAGSRALIWAIIGVAFLWAVRATGFGVMTLVDSLVESAQFVISDLWPPRIEEASNYIRPALDSLYMSYVGMVISVLISIPLGVLAARNITVYRVVAYAGKATAAFIRALPEIVLAIFLVAVFGIGPLAGTLALGIGGVGILAKAYADGIEAIDMRQIEGLRATGATWLQILAQGVWPQFKPTFLTWSLYRLELNIREAAVLGLVGAGGLGFSLQQAINLFQYRTAAAIILMIYVLVLFVETVTGVLRKRAL
jgi:phosphonate transport system permease protein